MREAAADYAKGQDMAKVRAAYQSISQAFPEQDMVPIRQPRNPSYSIERDGKRKRSDAC